MKKHRMLQVGAGIVLLALAVSASASLAWFFPTTQVGNQGETNTMPIDGSSSSSYFAYGDGVNRPYGIKTPRHLYNLAWLQYLGMIHLNDTQLKFELADNIDMSGWTLPPIGTETYPFIGNFDGKGFTVSNLTVSNNFSQYNVHPTIVNSTNYISPHIIGMFGVVGTYTPGTSASVASGQIDSIKDLTISNASIASATNTVLAGIVAGYVNGPIQNVGVINSNVDLSNQTTSKYSSFKNISDYTVVGYCESNFKEQTKKQISQLWIDGGNNIKNVNYTAQQGTNEQGWGGSVDMYTMFNNLNAIRTTINTESGRCSYPTTRTLTENENGEVVTDEYGNYSSARLGNNDSGFIGKTYDYQHAYYNYEQYGNDSNGTRYKTSSYGYVISTSNGNGNYMCLTGEKTVGVVDALTTTYSHYVDAERQKLVIKSGTHYLAVNGTAINNNITSIDGAADWIIDSEHRIYTIINGTNYYLNGYASLTLSTTPNCFWFYDNNNIYCTNGQYVYSVYYNNGAWTTSSSTPTYFYITDGNGNYLTHRGTQEGTPTNSTSPSNNTRWYYRNGAYRTSNNGNVYLNYYDGLYCENYDSYHYTLYNNTSLRYQSSYNGNQYVSFSNGSWTSSNNVFNIVFIPVGGTKQTITVTSETETYKKNVVETIVGNSTFEVNPTYFPLTNTNGVPTDKNTGYLVSGSKYYGDPNGDIRVSRFDRDTYLSRGLNTVYTIDGDGTHEITSSNASNYQRYADSKANLQTILNNSGNYIYGLHFMDAQISYGGNSSVFVPYAVVNGNEYYDYELPTDSINFNLKEKGFINFFGGSYFYNQNTGRNNSFFSLFEVQRNQTKTRITGMREIVKVYSCNSTTYPSYSNIFEYSDGTFSVPYQYVYVNGVKSKKALTKTGDVYDDYVEYSTTNVSPTATNSPYKSFGYALKFNTDWIKINTLKYTGTSNGYAYYFEIPSNDGEYALGSVPGGIGAYLMYLDIGANAEKISRTTVVDQIKIIEEIREYPKGVGMIVAAGNTVNDANSYCIVISGEYSGVVTMIRESESKGKALKSVESNAVALSYNDYQIKVYSGSGANETLYKDSDVTKITETTINRKTFYDFHPNSGGVETIAVIDTTIKTYNGDGTITTSGPIRTYEKDGVAAAANITIYDDEGHVYTNASISTSPITSFTDNNITLQCATYYTPAGTIKISFNINHANYESSEGTYQTINGYDVVVEFTANNSSQSTTNITAKTIIERIDSSTYSFTINTVSVTGVDQVFTIALVLPSTNNG